MTTNRSLIGRNREDCDLYLKTLSRDEVLMLLYNNAYPKRTKITLEDVNYFLSDEWDTNIEIMYGKEIYVDLTDLNNLDFKKFNKINKSDAEKILKKAVMAKFNASPLKNDVCF